MKKHLIVIGTVVLVLAVGFSGCIQTNVDNQDTMQLSIALFNVEPSMINKGETANLSWNITGATTVSIDTGIGDVNLSGTRIIYPSETTTFTITAKNKTKTLTATTLIVATDNTSQGDEDEDDGGDWGDTETIMVSGTDIQRTINYLDKPVKLMVSGLSNDVTVTKETNLVDIMLSGVDCVVRVSRNHSFTSMISGINSEIVYYD